MPALCTLMGSGDIVIDRKCLCHHGSHILVRETDVEEFMTKSIIFLIIIQRATKEKHHVHEKFVLQECEEPGKSS